MANRYEKTIPCDCENCKRRTLASRVDLDERCIILCNQCHSAYTVWADDLRTSGFMYDWMNTASARRCKAAAK